MQKLDMSSYGVEELDANEMKNLDGGFIIQTINDTILAIGVSAIGVIGTLIGLIGEAVGGLGGGAMASMFAPDPKAKKK